MVFYLKKLAFFLLWRISLENDENFEMAVLSKFDSFVKKLIPVSVTAISPKLF